MYDYKMEDRLTLCHLTPPGEYSVTDVEDQMVVESNEPKY